MLLQLALDKPDLNFAIQLLASVKQSIDIAEIGTPLLLQSGMAAVSSMRAAFPEATLLADTKIADGGALEAKMAFERGANIVTVLGFSHPNTIRAAVDTAHSLGGKVMVDLLNADSGLSVKFAETAAVIGADYICLHTAVDDGDSRKGIHDIPGISRFFPRERIALAGGVTPNLAAQIGAVPPGILIVGRSITTARDPVASAVYIRTIMEGLTIENAHSLPADR